jgi:GNAT superfamily N-acetyltransferase
MKGTERPITITIQGPVLGKASVCVPILRSLPAWFGIEEAIVRYATEIDRLSTFLAHDAGRVAGFLSLKRHSPYAAEVYVMGILPEMHRKGIGRALVQQAQQWLAGQGVEYLQVKTLGPSHSDPNYAKTRAFYTAMGFRPLEELGQIWNDQNPCLIMVKRL